MNKQKWITIILLLTMVCSFVIPASAVDSEGNFAVDAKAAMLIERNTGTVLYELDPHEQNYPASLTKIMTCLLALENGNLDDVITVSSTAMENLSAGGSSAGLIVGEELSLENLLYCVMVSSANEACNVVAEYVSGSVDAFVELMNTRAAELGCTGTHFANPHGLHDEYHYTTAYDLSLIVTEALKYDTFVTITDTPEYVVPATNKSEPRELITTNELIKDYSANSFHYSKAHGVKTGFTTPAACCLISTADDGNMQLLGIVMGAPTVEGEFGNYIRRSFPECINMFEYGFNSFDYRMVLPTLYPIAEITVNNAAGSETVALAPVQELMSLVPADFTNDDLTLDIQFTSETVDAPIDAGQVLGKVTVSMDGTVIGTSELAAITSVARAQMSISTEKKDTAKSDNWWKWLVGILFAIIAILLLLILLLQIRRRQIRRRKVAARRRALEAQRRREQFRRE